MTYTRFAIYFLPRDEPLAAFGSQWLGWNAAQGRSVRQSEIPGIEAVTEAPRRYGFHATLKPPFRLAEDKSADSLAKAVSETARRIPRARADGLTLSRLGRFLALTPVGDESDINRVAAACVKELDSFRAAPDASELARRRGKGLRPRQEEMLMRWGYPHVLDEFRFHLTLTGRLPRKDVAHWEGVLRSQLPSLPAPFDLNEIALVGERQDGFFELIDTFALQG